MVLLPRALALLALGTPLVAQWPAALETQVPSPDPSAIFGTTVDVEDATAVIAAPGAPSGGVVYVLGHGPKGWRLDTPIPHPTPAVGVALGTGADLEGDTLVLGDLGAGAGGRAYVYARTAGSWSLKATLIPPGITFGALFGDEVALDPGEHVVAISGQGHEDGTVWIWERAAGTHTWTQAAMLQPSAVPNGSGRFGESLALEGDMLLVGCDGFDQPGMLDTGAVFVFERVAGAWVETDVLYAPGAAEFEYFGEALALEGKRALIGCPQRGPSGAVLYYEHGGAGWTFQQELVPADAGSFEWFGCALDLQGTAALIGAKFDDAGAVSEAGSAYVFAQHGGLWSQQAKLPNPVPQAEDEAGNDVALDGTTALMGIHLDDLAGLNSGSAAFFELFPTGLSYCTAGTSASGCSATLSSAGLPSATAATGFELAASAVEGAKDGLFFFGTNGRQANPWGNGSSFQCVAPPVVRAGLLVGSGTVGACDGFFQQDLNAHWCATCPKPGSNPGAGTTVQAQLWYRDPHSSSNQTTSLSDALEFFVGP